MRTKLAGALGVYLLSAGLAHAQDALSSFSSEYDRGRNVGVYDRPRPEYTPIGVQLGAFSLSPALTTGISFTDNVFASDTNAQSDEIFSITPSLSAQSNWNRHALGFNASVTRYEHLDVDSQSSTDFTVGVHGRLDVLTSAAITASYQHSDLTESRYNSEAAAFSPEPSKYSTDYFDISASNQFNRVRVRLDASALNENFDNLVGFDGRIINNDTRDNTYYNASARADFALTPDTAIFGVISYDKRDFTNQVDLPGYFQRSSDGYQFLVGANFDITNLIRGEVGVGYFSDKVGGVGSSSDGVSLNARVEYFITPLTTITFNGNRGFYNSTVLLSPGDVSTSGSVRIDHEFRRNLLAFVQAGGSNQDYVGIDRNDDRVFAGGGVTYLVNRAAQVTLSYDHRSQTSNGTFRGYQYDANTVSLSLTLRR